MKIAIEVEVEQLTNAILEQLAEEDVVKVVRCKDCKYGDTHEMGVKLNNAIRCNIHDDGYEMHEPDWFCADGERRENA